MIWNRLKKLKRKCLSYLIAYSGKYLTRLILKTCKLNVTGLDNLTDSLETSSCILMLWHSKLIIVAEILVSYTSNISFSAFISKSRDGEPLAILADSYKRGTVLRVPHNARHIALNKMIDTLKNSKDVVIITPDGPKGPKEVVKSGIALAAKNSSALIIPFSWETNRFWTLNTWDQMKIPKPFSTIDAGFGKPIKLANVGENPVQSELHKDTEILGQALKTLERTLQNK